MITARFKIHLAHMSPPRTESLDNQGVGFDPRHESVFTELELQLRLTVETMMVEVVGPQWIKQRVPGGMRERWEERREKERSAGMLAQDVIHYSHFMELHEVICKRDNWRDVFKTVFRDKDDVTASFRRLLPVRNAIRHSRPLGRADELTLFSEATRLFKAINRESGAACRIVTTL